nr:hypothetical protein [Paracoccus saliphilus]
MLRAATTTVASSVPQSIRVVDEALLEDRHFVKGPTHVPDMAGTPHSNIIRRLPQASVLAKQVMPSPFARTPETQPAALYKSADIWSVLEAVTPNKGIPTRCNLCDGFKGAAGSGRLPSQMGTADAE